MELQRATLTDKNKFDAERHTKLLVKR